MVFRTLIKTWVLSLSLMASVSLVQAASLDDIKKKGEMVIGMEVAYEPYEYFKDGQIIGYDVDIANRFASKLGVKVTFLDTAWNGIVASLLAKKFDTILSGMTITTERAEKVNFSMPYADATNVLLVRLDDKSINTVDDIAGKRVGTQLASAGDKVAKEFEAALKAKGKPGYSDYKLYEHFPEAYVDLTNKRIDAVVGSLSTLLILIQTQPGKYRYVSGIQNVTAYYGMAFRKADTDFLKFVNEQFAEMKANGELAALQKKWFGDVMATPNEVPATLP